MERSELSARRDRHLVTNLAPEDVRHIVDTQVDTAGYLQPPMRLETRADRVFRNNEEIWRAIVDERIRANMVIHLESFAILEWFPRSPGLYFTEKGQRSRESAANFVQRLERRGSEDRYAIQSLGDDVVVYNPYGKVAMLQGGLGAIRLRPRVIAGREHWFMSASSNGVAHEGFPLAVPSDLYDQCIEAIGERGAVQTTVTGRLRFVPDEVNSLYADYAGVPRLYLLVEQMSFSRARTGSLTLPDPLVSVAVSFTSEYEGTNDVYASYVFFNPARKGSFERNVDWMENTYVKGHYQGTIITDFDEQKGRFSGAAFSLAKVMDLKLDDAEVEDTLKRLGLAHDATLYLKRMERLIVIVNRGELNMAEKTTIKDVTISNVNGGQIFLGRFNDVVANLTATQGNGREIAAALATAKDAIAGTTELSDEAKAEQIEVLTQIGEQVAKPKPNKTLLKSLGEGLLAAVKTIPSVLKSVLSVVELVGKFYPS